MDRTRCGGEPSLRRLLLSLFFCLCAKGFLFEGTNDCDKFITSLLITCEFVETCACRAQKHRLSPAGYHFRKPYREVEIFAERHALEPAAESAFKKPETIFSV